jgi:hypothetical protein
MMATELVQPRLSRYFQQEDEDLCYPLTMTLSVGLLVQVLAVLAMTCIAIIDKRNERMEQGQVLSVNSEEAGVEDSAHSARREAE